MKPIFTLIGMLLFSASAMHAGDIYVSTCGNDSLSGQADAPLRTVAEAMKRAREWRRLKSPEAEGDIRIILADGVYRQTEPLFVRPEDSGKPGSATIVCSAEGSNAVI